MKLYTADINKFTEYEKAFSMMSDARRNEVLRRRDTDRRLSVLGEWLARKGISEITGMSESDIVFAKSEKGKPYAVNADIEFSISHSGSVSVCAVSKDQIGVDIELIRPIDERIMRIVCTDSDREYILRNGEFDSEAQKRFFEVWTAKEAYFKYSGTGINGLKTVSLTDILPNCRITHSDGYILTVYSDHTKE